MIKSRKKHWQSLKIFNVIKTTRIDGLKIGMIPKPGIAAIFLVVGGAIVRILTDLPEVRSTAMVYLPWLIASPLISVWCFLYDGVYVGMTRAREMRNIMLVSAFAVFLPAWYLLQGFGNHGLWAAFTLFMASRGIGMHMGYRKAMRVAHGPDVSERS